jgi:hypothetical protein
MFNRALVKIAINCLIYCYPEVKLERAKLQDAVSFVMNGEGTVPFAAIQAESDLDQVEKSHNIFFINSDGIAQIRISLYNGGLKMIFYFPMLNALNSKGPGRLLIDHINMKNVFHDHNVLTASLEAIENKRNII